MAVKLMCLCLCVYLLLCLLCCEMIEFKVELHHMTTRDSATTSNVNQHFFVPGLLGFPQVLQVSFADKNQIFFLCLYRKYKEMLFKVMQSSLGGTFSEQFWLHGQSYTTNDLYQSQPELHMDESPSA